MLKLKDLNQNLVKVHYAVRGPIVLRAQELEKLGRKITYCNIGNPQALRQKPITYLRQLLSLLEYPQLLEKKETSRFFPKDIRERARRILAQNPNGLGAYTQSEGMPFVRKAVAEFIEKRDRIKSNADRIILTDGASKGIQLVLMALMKNKKSGFMIPIPQYPLYSATVRLYGAKQIDYYLNEKNDWQLSEKELTLSINSARKREIRPVAIIVINPGNPTGSVFSKDNIKMIINFARKNKLAILADEVYQENIYAENRPFHSFAKILVKMKIKDVPLFSFHSVSKGFLGECGHRGGYVELRNIPEAIYQQMLKLQSIGLCANTAGQIAVYTMVAPPSKGEESYNLYQKEKNLILSELKEKAEILAKGLDKINGMTIKVPRGAMYAFVKVNLPTKKNISKMSPAERLKYESKLNFDYCLKLLEETGICVVPGSGFGQMAGTFHFRTTFLPPKEEIKSLVEKLAAFHKRYIQGT